MKRIAVVTSTPLFVEGGHVQQPPPLRGLNRQSEQVSIYYVGDDNGAWVVDAQCGHRLPQIV